MYTRIELNMEHYSKELIISKVKMIDVIEAVKQAFSMTEKGLIDTPLRTVIQAEEGALLFMPAYSKELGLAVLKNVNVFLKNADKGLPTTIAEVMLIDAKDGKTLAVLDGTYVTQLRTAAASGAAFDVLGKKKCYKGALIGTGSIAETQLEAMLTVRDLKEVSIYSLHHDRCEAFVERMRTKHSNTDLIINFAQNSSECVENADLIIVATTSEKPVFDGSLVKKGATISCVGTYEPNKHEIDSILITRADKIFCDNKEAVLKESGDILIPLNQGLISLDDINGGLGEVINGTIKGRENDDEIIVFETVGIAAQDLIASSLIYNRINK